MKNLIFIIGLVLITLIGLWVFQTTNLFNKIDFNQVLVVSLFVGFSVLVAFKRFKRMKNGEPDKDELSELILQKAASSAFYTSLYMWLIISYFNNRSEVKMEAEQLIGYGIMGMAILFACFWLYFKFKGLKND